jgi:hypothetical protein
MAENAGHKGQIVARLKSKVKISSGLQKIEKFI